MTTPGGSEAGSGPARETPGGRPGGDARGLNARMTQDILSRDPQPYADGGYVLRVVEVQGRRSSTTVRVPIAVVTVGETKYLVSPTRERNWVRNLQADPRCVVTSRDAQEPSRAVPVEDPETVATVVGQYLSQMRAPWAIRAFPVPQDAGRSQLVEAAGVMAVFRIDAA